MAFSRQRICHIPDQGLSAAHGIRAYERIVNFSESGNEIEEQIDRGFAQVRGIRQDRSTAIRRVL